MTYRYNCRHFQNDIPCAHHKETGVACNGSCQFFEPADHRIIIIKLDAIGDVLRTTFIAPVLKRDHPRSHITWVTRKNAAPLLTHNPYLDELLSCEDTDCLLTMQTTKYDLCVSLDASPVAAKMASLCDAKEKKGFIWDKSAGYVVSANTGAQQWYDMGHSDELKKRNNRPYQYFVSKILEMDVKEEEYLPILRFSEAERRHKAQWAQARGIDAEQDIIIGINAGAGSRWPMKQWRKEGYVSVIKKLIADHSSVKIMLLGGPEEAHLLDGLKNELNDHKRVFSSGADNSLRHFAAIVDLCDIVVTGDTMALHMALATNKHVVALFGPTSAAEIYLPQGNKIVSPIACACCYRKTCSKTPHCMDLITENHVYGNLVEMLGRVKKPSY